jgi:hypothetical protein
LYCVRQLLHDDQELAKKYLKLGAGKQWVTTRGMLQKSGLRLYLLSI